MTIEDFLCKGQWLLQSNHYEHGQKCNKKSQHLHPDINYQNTEKVRESSQSHYPIAVEYMFR
jgi:hypothetical protein